MKRAVVVASLGAQHQQSWGGAFADGLRRHGWSAELSTTPKPCDLLIRWGVRAQDQIRNQKNAGGEVCILERGYLGERFEWTSVSFGGGLNGHGHFYGPFHDASRWQRHFSYLMKPWQARCGYALILGQVPNDMSLHGLKPHEMWNRAAVELASAGYEVRFRPHPKAAFVTVPNALLSGGSLDDAFSGAALAVGINSNATVESVLAGVPTVTLNDRAMARPVTGHQIGEIVKPDRKAWAHALSWKQWSIGEMRSGYCWEHVGGGIAAH